MHEPNAQEFAELEELFHTALGLGTGDRPGFLTRACGDRPELRVELERLLRFHQSDREPLHPHLVLPLDSPLPPGSIVGNYRVIRPIGEGGCGMVYLAEQLHPVRRRVALKWIKPGMASHTVVARFQGELQTLASLSHKSIARVFDAGKTDLGRPFFAMEFVDGNLRPGLARLFADGRLDYSLTPVEGYSPIAALPEGRLGMVHHRQGLTLVLEPGHHPFAVHPQLDRLQGDPPTHRLALLRHVDHPAAPFPDLFQELAPAESLAHGILRGRLQDLALGPGILFQRRQAGIRP